MEEKDVGISCFANSCAGFRGVLKQRYSDFSVNEVDPEGNVVHLTSLEAPPEEDVKVADFSISEYEQHLEAFKELAGEVNSETIRKLLQTVAAAGGDSDDVPSATLLRDEDKAHRTKVHSFFREKMPLFITDTVVENSIRVRFNDGSISNERGKRNRGWKGNRPGKRQKQDFDRRGGSYWPADRKKFCQFYMCKENKTTQSALMLVAQKLGVNAKNMGFAGTKDKRGVTTQRVTVFKHSAAELAALNKSLFGIKIGNFSYVDKGLVLGDLSGNRFEITLRDVVAENDSLIGEAGEALGNSGFINYYGLQRFGTSGVPTHAVGAKLLRGDWKGAVELILQPREGEIKQAEEARKAFQNEGPASAWKLMPHHMIAERSVLSGLKRDPGNFLQAIRDIPRPMRMMYVHSYQSYLWNNAASYRIQKHGISNVLEGDLVFCVEDSEPKNETIESEELEGIESLEDDACLELSSRNRRKVKHLTSEDVESGKYNITDVVLPLFGSSCLYPGNDVTNVYHELAKKDSIDLNSCPHGVKEFSVEHLPGAYRNILVKPVDFNWKLTRYNEPNKALSKSDMDKLQPKRGEEEGVDSEAQQAFLALQLEFTLPTSSYATMALREVMKMSTSVAVHKSLSEAQLLKDSSRVESPATAPL